MPKSGEGRDIFMTMMYVVTQLSATRHDYETYETSDGRFTVAIRFLTASREQAVDFIEGRAHRTATAGRGACIAQAGDWSVLEVPMEQSVSILATPVMHLSLEY